MTDIVTPESTVNETMSQVGGIDTGRLRSLIERIERLEEEKKSISLDIRDIFAEAKAIGFDVKIMRAVLKLCKMNAPIAKNKSICLKLIVKPWTFRNE